MSNILYTKKETVNKNLVQDIIYQWTSLLLKNSDVTILLGAHPYTAIRRVMRYISDRNSVIIGYENNPETWKIIKTNRYTNLLPKLMAPFKGKNYRRIIMNPADVMNGQITEFEDLDLCATFINNRKRADQFLYKEGDSLYIFKNRLELQNKMGFKWKFFGGTVSTRNSNGKEYSKKCLSHILSVMGWEIESIDDEPYGYAKGSPVLGSGTIHANGGLYFAYEHDCKLKRVSHDLQKASDAASVQMRMFTYNDSQSMLTFGFLYTNQ